MKFFTLDSMSLKGKVVGVRVDINSPLNKGKVMPNERIVAHAKTLAELSKKGARVVILAHQGRKGDEDCISLKNHLALLEKHVGKKIAFCNEIYSQKSLLAISQLKDGELLLLENLRFIDDETDLEKKDNKVLALESSFDAYVLDAFSVAHRKQASMIGFKHIPLLAGRVMEKELKGLNSLSSSKKTFGVFVWWCKA